MGFLDRLFGGGDSRDQRPAPPVPQARQLSDDELAVERYRYLLRTAPPESIEAVHTEAFAKLTPEQRQAVYRSLAEQMPAGERLVSDEPSALARAATRAELRSPGSMERAFNGAECPGWRPRAGRTVDGADDRQLDARHDRRRRHRVGDRAGVPARPRRVRGRR